MPPSQQDTVLRASELIYSRDPREYKEGRAMVARLADHPHLPALRAGLEGD